MDSPNPSSLKRQETVEVQIKKLVDHAVIPEYSKDGDAGLDLVAVDVYRNRDYKFIEFGTGLAIKIPEGYVGLLYPRSSISKTPHTLCNSVGVIDSGYTGELLLRFKYDENNEDMEYSVGDKVAQLVVVPYPKVKFHQVETLEKTNRGDSGFGSTGK